MSSDNDTDTDIECTPPNLRIKTKFNILPAKSKEIYNKTYDHFVIWKSEKKAHTFSESVLLAYFNDLAKSKQPSSLWAIFSMLKCTIQIKHDIDIKEYKNVTSFLKRQSTGFQSKKSMILTSENINRFLHEAPDYTLLATKVALVLGINGACRTTELINIKVNDIKICDQNIMIVILRDTNTHIDRTFVVRDEFINIVKKYQKLRPINSTCDRFFLNYMNGKCTKQPIGKNKMAAMPKQIAKYLELPNAERYTGHCFRRSSATLLANSGANLTALKRHGAWNFDKAAESYIEDSIQDESDITSKINENIELEPRTKRHSSVSGQSLEESFANKEVSDQQPSTSDQVLSPQASTSLADLKLRWKTIRDGYWKYQKQVQDSASTGKKVCDLWQSYLMSLDSHYVKRSTRIKKRSASQDLIYPPEYYEEAEDLEQDTEVPLASPPEVLLTSPPGSPSTEIYLSHAEAASSPSSSPIPSTSRASHTNNASRKRRKYSDNGSDIDKVIHYLNKKSDVSKGDDADLLFQSYAISFKKLNKSQQSHVKLEMAKLFVNTELGLLYTTQAPSTDT